MRKYLVGGAVRDEIMGLKSKDLDYTVVLDSSDINTGPNVVRQESPFDAMVRILKIQGYTIFLENPEFLTVRARSPEGEAADFVLSRKESGYTDGRRPDSVGIGTLEDDLARRDFTCNAIAKDERGDYIDPFNGLADIEAGVLRAVGDGFERLTEDALRAVRALRFSVTKGFRIDNELAFVMESSAVLSALEHNIADERIADELSKMFRYDTLSSLSALGRYPGLTRALFSGKVSLASTMKQRRRK